MHWDLVARLALAGTLAAVVALFGAN